MTNSFSSERYKTALGNYLPFKPLFEDLKEADFMMIAKRLTHHISWHAVQADDEPSYPFRDALLKFSRPEGEYALGCAIWSDTGLNIKKARVRLEADMHRGKVKKSDVYSIAIFATSAVRMRNHFSLFIFNKDIGDF